MKLSYKPTEMQDLQKTYSYLIKANHGKRPCSSVMRKLKKKQYFRKLKETV